MVDSVFRVDVEGVLVVSISEFRVYGLGRSGLLTLGSLGYGGLLRSKDAHLHLKFTTVEQLRTRTWNFALRVHHEMATAQGLFAYFLLVMLLS